MCGLSAPVRPPGAPEALHARFLTLLPKVEAHGRIVFRHLPCPGRREDAVQEMRALAWLWFLRLARKGKDPADFPAMFATLLARAVRSGRRLAGMERSKDVLAPRAQQRRGFAVSPLPCGSSLGGSVFDEALRDNTRSGIPDQVSFRIDFRTWRRTRTDRDRRLMDRLMAGGHTQEVAREFGVSAARVAQLRREFCDDWTRFCGDAPSAHAA